MHQADGARKNEFDFFSNLLNRLHFINKLRFVVQNRFKKIFKLVFVKIFAAKISGANLKGFDRAAIGTLGQTAD